MSDQASHRPAICLNMIVRNEAHIVEEVLNAVAPYINSWVIVDTGSDDGTQYVIRRHLARLDIPGELHERPWRNFGYNRSEALTLAQGRADYIWVIDADDMVVGVPDFDQLGADVYTMRYRDGGISYWRRQLFRDQLPWHYKGVVHEYAECDAQYVEQRLEGDYHIDSRRLGARNLDPQKYARDRDLLLAELEREPDDERSVFYLAQSYFDLGDIANARRWYARRTEMAGWDEETYYAMFRVAASMALLGEPWPQVHDAYQRAWEYRPTRAEPLHAIACQYRIDQRYRLGHLFAQRAADIPAPEDQLFVDAEVYAWRAADELAICASWIGQHAEAFGICRHLLARADLPEDDRTRIAGNRDVSAPALIERALVYPDALARSLTAGPYDAEVTVSLIAGPDRTATEHTLNSFLQSCIDIDRVGRFVVINAGLTAEDRATLLERYRFLEFTSGACGSQLAHIRTQIGGRLWLHLGQGWHFFTPEHLIGRLWAVLDAEPEVFQVGINVGDAVGLTGVSAPEHAVRRGADSGRYVLTETVARGPAMFDTTRLDRVGVIADSDLDSVSELTRRAFAAGLAAASLDEVLCVAPDVEHR